MPNIPMPNQSPVRLRNGSVVYFWQYPDCSQPCPMCGDVGAHWYDLDCYNQAGGYETMPIRWGDMCHVLCPVCRMEGAFEDYFATDECEELSGNFVPKGLRLEQGWEVLRYQWLERCRWHAQAIARLCSGHMVTPEMLINFGLRYSMLCEEQRISPMHSASKKPAPPVDLTALSTEDWGYKGTRHEILCGDWPIEIHVFPHGEMSCVLCGQMLRRWDHLDTKPEARVIVEDCPRYHRNNFHLCLCSRCKNYLHEIDDIENSRENRLLQSHEPDEVFAFFRIARLLKEGWLPQQLAVLQTGLNLSGNEVREQWAWAVDILRKLPPASLAKLRITDLDRITEAHWRHALHPGSSTR